MEEVEVLARIAFIYGEYLNDKGTAKLFADRAAAINPGQPVLDLAYSAANIKYNSDKYADKFINAAHKPVNSHKEAVNHTDELIESISLAPNPANPATTITYSLNESAHISINIYNILGQRIDTLVNRYQPAGIHKIVFDGAKLSSGIYFYRILSENTAHHGKLLLLK